MKHLITIFCFAIFIFLNSCKKDNASGNTSNSEINGSWELGSTQSSMVPTSIYPSGNGNIIQFTDSIYKKYTNGSLTKTGNYRLIQDNSVMKEVGLIIPSGEFTNRIIFDNDFINNKTFIQVANKKLTFLSGYFPLDGGSKTSYKKR